MSSDNRKNILDEKSWFSRDETRESRTINIVLTFNSGEWWHVGGVLRNCGEDDNESRIWNVRAAQLSIALAKALVYLRDKNEIEINVETIKESLIFENFISLVKRIEPPNSANEFLENMPGYLDSSTQQSSDFMDAYGYLQMRFYAALSELKDDIDWSKSKDSVKVVTNLKR